MAMGRAQIQSANWSTACRPGPDAISKQVADNELAQRATLYIKDPSTYIYVTTCFFTYLRNLELSVGLGTYPSNPSVFDAVQQLPLARGTLSTGSL